MEEFVKFPKIPRLSREIVITEKIDGTNAQVYITEDGEIYAGSRTKWVTPENDNHGFAKWVQAHKDDLLMLGPGHHFGEFWGKGIQRNYGLQEKRFSLFNVSKWGEARPFCCHVVPVLFEGPFDTEMIDLVLKHLSYTGSIAAPGFMKPEGIVIWHSASGHLYKKTIENDDKPKGDS